MAAKKSYNRFFIIFQEEDKGYGIAIDKQPTGYAKIEVKNGKCKITVYAQNLKKEKGPYYFCIIDTVKTPGQLVNVGEIRIDEIGRGETWWEYNEDNIAESNCSIEKFNVAIILAQGEYTLAPLVGYTGKDKIMWKDKIFIKNNEEHEEAHEEKDEHEHEHEHERECEIENETKFGGIEKVDSEIPEEPRLLDEEGLKFEKYEEELRNEAEAEISNGVNDGYDAGCIEMDGVRDDENNKKHKMYKSNAVIFHEVLDQFEEMDNFLDMDGKNECRWWRIPYNCKVKMMEDRHYPFLCTIFHLNMTYPNIDYIKYYCDKGYYYFGIKYDKENEVKYLMYGIEGKNEIREQPYMGMTGFGKWMKIKDMDNGVWIMFYNPKTGNFMIEKR